MRIPKLDNRSRAGLLGLGMFMVALSTAAEFAVSVEQEDQQGVPHTAALERSNALLDTNQCRDELRNQAMARLQQL